MGLTVVDLVAVILAANAMPVDKAKMAARAACDALRINPMAQIPVVELSRPSGDNARPDDVNLAVYLEYVENGGEFSERAMPSGAQYWKQGESKRFCHMTAGGCSVAETENVPMHHGNNEGPKFKIGKGTHAGKPYKPTMHPVCLARLEELALEARGAE